MEFSDDLDVLEEGQMRGMTLLKRVERFGRSNSGKR